MKLRDKLTISVVGAFANFNPEKKDRVVKKFKFLGKLGKFPFRLKRGFEKISYNVNGVPLEIFKRKDTGSKKLVFIIHGGAFIMDVVNTYRILHSKISDAANGAAVAIVDYRTAPDYIYPAAHDDVMAGWEYLLKLGYLPQNIILVGDSSGGNLVLSLLLKLRDQNKPMPAAAVAMSPWADLTAAGESYKRNYNLDIMFGRKKSVVDDSKLQKILECGVFAYAKDADRRDPYLSPVFGDYHGMPPTLLTVGSSEMLLDDTLTIAGKIKAEGGDVKVIVGEGMFHVYPLFYQFSPKAKETFLSILSFIKKHSGETID